MSITSYNSWIADGLCLYVDRDTRLHATVPFDRTSRLHDPEFKSALISLFDRIHSRQDFYRVVNEFLFMHPDVRLEERYYNMDRLLRLWDITDDCVDKSVLSLDNDYGSLSLGHAYNSLFQGAIMLYIFNDSGKPLRVFPDVPWYSEHFEVWIPNRSVGIFLNAEPMKGEPMFDPLNQDLLKIKRR